MKETITIHRATGDEAHVVAKFVEKLLEEIMQKINTNAFNFDLEQTTKRLEEFIESEKNFVFVAKEQEKIRGIITIYESFALYAEGAFGTIAELFVCPKYRSQGIGKMLVEKVKVFGNERGWSRLEVTTPPLPEFDETLSFYEKEAFEITGGRKMKIVLQS